MRYTENHDIDRTAVVYPPPSDRTVAALVFSLPGVPLIYTGQEIGMKRKPGLFDKDPVPWDQGDADTRAFYKKLAALRRAHPSLRHGALKIVENSKPGQVLSFTRTTDDESMLAVFNFSDKALEVTVGQPDSGKPISLEPWGFVVVRND
jgi:glycosidase